MNSLSSMLGGVILLMIISSMIFFSRQNFNIKMDTDTTTIGTSTIESSMQLANGLPEVITHSSAFRSDTTALVTGTILPNGVPTEYWYEYGSTDVLGSSTPLLSLGSGKTILPAPGYISGLVKSSSYFFRLTSRNQYGTKPGSVYTFRTTNGVTLPKGGLPLAKTLNANKISSDSAILWGEITPNTVGTDYWFEYGKTMALGNVTKLNPAGNGASLIPVSEAINTLEPKTSYSYRINAQNAFGTVNGAILSFTTTSLLGEQVLSPSVETYAVTTQATSSVTVSGRLNPNGNATVYWFEYSADPFLDEESLIRTSEQAALTTSLAQSYEAQLSPLTSSTTYYYRMVAQNSFETVRGNRESFNTP